MILRPSWNSLSQGTIFSEAIAEDYAFSEVFGLTITARCDFVHAKVKKFNYLPVVPIENWIKHDGRIQIAHRARRNLEGKMTNLLKNLGLDPTILKYQPLDEVLSRHFPDPTRAQAKAIQSLRDCQSELCNLEKYESILPEESDAREVGNYASIAQPLMRHLVSNNLSGYYFLPAVAQAANGEFSQRGKGYVVLLREIRHMPSVIANQLVNGLSSEEYSELLRRHGVAEGGLMIRDDELAIVTGQLESPNIEHLLQCFTTLFSRIGLPDPEETLVDDLWESITAANGSQS